MRDKINDHYKDILPEDVQQEIDERLRDIEVHQEEVVSVTKDTLPLDFRDLNFI